MSEEKNIYQQLDEVVRERAQLNHLKAKLAEETRATLERAALEIHGVGPGVTVLAKLSAWNEFKPVEVVGLEHKYCWPASDFTVRSIIAERPVLKVRERLPLGTRGSYVAVVFANQWMHIPKEQQPETTNAERPSR